MRWEGCRSRFAVAAFFRIREITAMKSKNRKYYVVTQDAVPEVLLKVVEAKRLLDTGKAETIQDATEAVGISRSSFYKYRDDIFPFHENAQGKTITFMLEMRDEPGLLSDVLRIVAEHRANILTIHQSIPIGGRASTTISVEILPSTGDISEMIRLLEETDGVMHMKIAGQD